MTDGIYLLLGTNLGDRVSNLHSAINSISAFSKIKKLSSVYETAAWGKIDQPSFYNQVIEIETSLGHKQLLQQILKCEQKLGRIRHEKWGERIIDIDILYYNQDILNTKTLIIPHPGIPDRKFTLVPLCEIANGFKHPLLRKTNQKLLNELDDQLLVKKLIAHT